MKAGHFVDTSVWIPYFRDSASGLGDFIDDLIDEGLVHINGIVLAELLTGARTSAELDRLKLALAGLKYVPSDRESCGTAGRNGFALKRKGVSVPMSDLIIATDCIEHGLVLIDRDRHYEAIAAHLPLARHALSGGPSR
jgi:predicted nucleic acid-binding protein